MRLTSHSAYASGVRARLSPAILHAAAAGAVAFTFVAAAEIIWRFRVEPSLTSPLTDLSLLAWQGAAGGLVLRALAGLPRLSWLSPFGVTLGVGATLAWALAGLAGGGFLNHKARLLLQSVTLVLLGGVLGQILVGAVRRFLTLHPQPRRDLIVLAVLLLPAVIPAWDRSAASDRPNVLLLSIDTLRGDRMGWAGCSSPLTPHLDRLARRGSIWTQVVTPLPRTVPSLASLLTGCYPHKHGVRDNVHYVLGSATVTLAEILRAEGWATAAVNANAVISHDSGLYQGFASANDRGADWARLAILRGQRRLVTLCRAKFGSRPETITDLALTWLRGRSSWSPFFLWVHWLGPHRPYDPVWPTIAVLDPDYEGRFEAGIGYGIVPNGILTYRNTLTPRERRWAVAMYDSEVAATDRALGRLLREMEAAGQLVNTIILATADHGESLGEHDYFFEHGDFVYGTAANVPLVLCNPARRGPEHVNTTTTSLIDWFAYLVGHTTGEGPRGIDAADPAASRPIFGESGFCRYPHLNDHLGWPLPSEIALAWESVPDWHETWAERANRAKQRFVQHDGWKLVRTPREDGDRTELFNLAADPGETRNVVSLETEIAARLGGLLDEWMASGAVCEPPADERIPDETTREALEALGYVGN